MASQPKINTHNSNGPPVLSKRLSLTVDWRRSQLALEELGLEVGETKRFNTHNARLARGKRLVLNCKTNKPIHIYYQLKGDFVLQPVHYTIVREAESSYSLVIDYFTWAQVREMGGIYALKKKNIRPRYSHFRSKKYEAELKKEKLPSSKELSEEEMKKLRRKY